MSTITLELEEHLAADRAKSVSLRHLSDFVIRVIAASDPS